MAEQTSGTIDIEASAEEVLDVITDFGSYTKWAKGVKSTKVLKKDSKGRPLEVVIEAGQMGFNSKQTLKYSYKASNGGVSWKSTKCEGVTKSVEGSYDLVKRQAERMITDSALQGLKKEVERR